MKALRKTSRLDNIRNEERPAQRNTGKWIYISLLISFFAWLIDYSIGDYVFFKSEGMIINEEAEIALDYTASIGDLHFQKGDKVKKGDKLLDVNSVQVLKQISELSIKISELSSKKIDIEKERNIILRIMPLAEKRANDTTKLRKTQEFAISKGLITTRDMSDLLEKEYDGQMNQQQLAAKIEISENELKEINVIINQLKDTLHTIQSNYSNGEIRAINNGVVSDITVNSGGVVNSGDPIMTILTGTPYILAYIKPGAIYSVKPDEKVKIRVGIDEIEGTITQILPISTRLPDEFQHSFRPKERSQIIRIEFKENEMKIPPTFTKVTITKDMF